jgi:hypothetical protein
MCARESRRDMTLKQKKSKPYSFRRDKVAKIFKEAIENGLILPTSKRPTEMEKYSDSNYCPYHRVLGHLIEDCWVFKDWIEKRDTTPSFPPKMCSGAQNMKRGPVALGTTENESGSAKHENRTRRPRYRRKQARSRKT